MNGATALSANIINKLTINRTKIRGTSHHFFVSLINAIISLMNCILLFNDIITNYQIVEFTFFESNYGVSRRANYWFSHYIEACV